MRKGDDSDNPDTKEAEATGCGVIVFEVILKAQSHNIYTHVVSVAPSGTNRWHRDVQVRDVIANQCDRVGLIGSTEMNTYISLYDFCSTEFEGWTNLGFY